MRSDAADRESWYGQWRIDGRLVKRRVGPKRQTGDRDGLTKALAERELRRLIDEVAEAPAREFATLEELGRRHIERLTMMRRMRSTLIDYESTLRVHLVPFFGTVRSPRSLSGMSSGRGPAL